MRHTPISRSALRRASCEMTVQRPKKTSRPNPWRYFRVRINGRNFQLSWEDKAGRVSAKRKGFYTTVHVRARNPAEAELRAVNVLRRDKKLRASVRNVAADPPRMFVDEIVEVASFKGCLIPRTGFAFYSERGPRIRRK
jgi:hypothetical protein